MGIDGLFQRLIKDQRHNNISKLSYSPTERTIFAAWQMKYILLNEDEKPLQHIIDICCFEDIDDHFVEKFIEFLKAYGKITKVLLATLKQNEN